MQQSTANYTPTQRRITLIRHAKAVEGDGVDITRTLSARGEGDAQKLGAWLTAEQAFPDLFLCSTAQRTRQTLAAFNTIVPTILTERLYLASAADILKLLTEMDDAAMHLGIIGHNPGLHLLATQLVGAGASAADADRLALKFPTSACAIFTVACDHWRALAPASATLLRFVTLNQYAD